MRTSSGFTILEVMIATVCLGIIGLGIVGASTTSSKALKANATLLECQAAANRCVQELERHLRAASLSSLATTPPGFTTPQPLADGVAVEDVSWWAFAYDPNDADALPSLIGSDGVDNDLDGSVDEDDEMRFSMTAAASDTDPANGVDDDMDGVVDDVDIILVRPGSAAEVVARDVAACSFTLDGRTLTCTVLVRKRMPDGNPALARATRTVEIRND